MFFVLVVEAGSYGPGNVGGVLLGLHAQHGDAGRAPLKLWFGLKGVVAVGGRREKRVATEVVEGNVAKLVLLVGEVAVAVIGGSGGGRARGVGGHAGGRTSGQHAGRHHGSGRRGARPQVVWNLSGQEGLVSGRQKKVRNFSQALT